MLETGNNWACPVLYQATTEAPCDCTPLEEGCEPVCSTADPPELEDACRNVNLSEENPASCSPIETTTYHATRIAFDPEPTSGFDLDGTSGSSCVEGSQARPDGPGGIDNSFGAIDPTSFNFELLEWACEEPIGLSLRVDANPERNCATVAVFLSGETITSAPLHLNAGCLHGRLDRFVLPLPEQIIELANARVSATLDATGFNEMAVGAVADSVNTGRLAEALGADGRQFELRDIHVTSDAGPDAECNSISLTLKLGGIAD